MANYNGSKATLFRLAGTSLIVTVKAGSKLEGLIKIEACDEEKAMQEINLAWFNQTEYEEEGESLCWTLDMNFGCIDHRVAGVVSSCEWNEDVSILSFGE